jgi:hypothetical protein
MLFPCYFLLKKGNGVMTTNPKNLLLLLWKKEERQWDGKGMKVWKNRHKGVVLTVWRGWKGMIIEWEAIPEKEGKEIKILKRHRNGRQK